MSGTGVQERVERLLGLSVPSSILSSVDGRQAEIECELEQTDIEKLIPERPPRLQVHQAVIYRIGEDRWAIAPFSVTADMCEGHFPSFPVLPLAEAGYALAQVAEVLAAYTARCLYEQEGPFTPVVMRVGKVSAEGKDFVVPGDMLSLVAQGRRARINAYQADTFGYLGQQRIFSMPEVLHLITNDPRLWGREQG